MLDILNAVETAMDIQGDQIKIQNESREQIIKDSCTVEELLNFRIKEVPFLWKNLIPQSGLCCLTGSSDCNKSTLLRQLAVQIASGESKFLGFDLSPRYRRVIYISTEDDFMSTAAILGRQYPQGLPSNVSRNIKVIFNTDNHIADLEKELSANKTDLVCIDTWTDLFGDGDINQSGKVRANLEKYKRLARKYGCAFVFIHHQGKASEGNSPSKHFLLGSQAIEAKMRTVIELRKGNGNGRLMTITKGNYTSDNMKNKSFLLEMDEERILFKNNSSIQQLNAGNQKMKYNKENIMNLASPLKKQGNSYTQIHSTLVSKLGENSVPGLTTLKSWFAKQPVSHSPSK